MSYTNVNRDFRANKLTLAHGARLDGAANVGPSLWSPEATQNHALGREVYANDGTHRAWRYCENGSTAIAKSLMVAAEALDTQCKDSLQDATHTHDAGDQVINIVTDTGNAIVNGDLIGSFMFFNQGSTAIQGDYYLIKNNTWVTVGVDTELKIEIADEGGLRAAVAATDNISIVKHKCKDVVVNPVTLVDVMLGITMALVPADYFFWAQFRGPACCLVESGDSLVAGEPVGHIDGSDTVGAIGLVSTHATDYVVGHLFCYAAAGDYAMVDLTGLG